MRAPNLCWCPFHDSFHGNRAGGAKGRVPDVPFHPFCFNVAPANLPGATVANYTLEARFSRSSSSTIPIGWAACRRSMARGACAAAEKIRACPARYCSPPRRVSTRHLWSSLGFVEFCGLFLHIDKQAHSILLPISSGGRLFVSFENALRYPQPCADLTRLLQKKCVVF